MADLPEDTADMSETDINAVAETSMAAESYILLDVSMIDVLTMVANVTETVGDVTTAAVADVTKTMEANVTEIVVADVTETADDEQTAQSVTADSINDDKMETAEKINDDKMETADTINDEQTETAEPINDEQAETAEPINDEQTETAEPINDEQTTQSMTAEPTATEMDQSVNLTPNINMAHLRNFLTTFHFEYPVKKGYIIKLFLSGFKPMKIVQEIVSNVHSLNDSLKIDENSLKWRMHNFTKKFKFTMKPNFQRNFSKFCDFLREDYPLPLVCSSPAQSALALDSTSEDLASATTGSSRPLPRPPPVVSSCHVSTTTDDLEHLVSHEASLVPVPVADSFKGLPATRSSSIRCIQCYYKRCTINALKTKCANLKLEHKKKKEEIKMKFDKAALKVLRQKVKRKNIAIKLLKEKFHIVKASYEKEQKELLRQINKLSNDFKKQKEQRDENKQAVSSMAVTIFKKDSLIEDLTEQLNEKFRKEVQIKNDDGHYSIDLRKCIFKLLIHNVAADKCQEILNYAAEHLFKIKFSAFPTLNTIRQMYFELSVLVDIHVGHILNYHCDAATISMEATTFDGRRVNQVHVVTSPSPQTLILDVSDVSGATTEDHHSQVSQAVLDIIRIFSHAAGLPEMTVKNDFVRKIKNTFLYRTKGNYPGSSRRKEFNLDLMELKGSVHHVDCLARAAKLTLAKLDKKWDLTVTGKSCLVEKLVCNVVKMRYSSDVGDPQGFRSFLKKRKLPNKKFILPYGGSRLSLLFYMCAATYNIRTPLLKFLSQHKSKLLAADTFGLLQKPLVQIQLHCMGLFCQILSGPWMREFCRTEENVTHVQPVPSELFRKCVDTLACVIQDPDFLFSTKSDVFGKPLEPVDSTLQDIQCRSLLFSSYATLYRECIVELATAFNDTLHSQLRDVLANVQSTSEEAAAGSDVRSENTSELIDAMCRRLSNTNLGFFDGTTRALLNKTTEWLDGLNTRMQESYISFARSQASKVRMVRLERDRAADDKITKSQEPSSQKVVKGQKKKLEKLIVNTWNKEEDVFAMSCFESLAESDKERLRNFLKGEDDLSSHVLEHVWREDGEDVTYLELVQSVETIMEGDMTSCRVVLYYWKEGEDVSDNYLSLAMHKFLADFATGDLKFLH